MSRYELTSRGGALLLSTLIHAMLFLHWNGRLGVDAPALQPQPQITQLRFRQQTASAVLSDVQVTQPVHKIDRNPPVPEKAAPKKKTQRVKKPRPAPAPEPVAEQTRHQPQETPETVAAKQATPPPVQGNAGTSSRESYVQQQEALYLKALLAHIETYKFYPRAARRRGIEGTLAVSFMLTPDIRPDKIEIQGGRSVLQQAARQAVTDAAPFPLPPAELKLPRRIAFTMVYALKG